MNQRKLTAAVSVCALAATLTACGGSSKSSQPSTTPSPTSGAPTTPTPTGPVTTTQGPGALQAEAKSAAAGDIPDNQVFLTFNDAAGSFSIKYPEGWAQSGAAGTVTFRDKNNIVRIVVTKGSPPTMAAVRQQLAALQGARLTTPPQTMNVNGSPAIHAVYETKSAPNPVTGKTVTLGVDRYYLWKGKRVAIIDLASPIAPVKVDNIDAYRLIIQSFRWR
jgi:hypothetical protein